MQNNIDDYKSRINRVVDFIEKNLSKNFTLNELAQTACFSKFHFHRIFFSLTGETLFRFIQRLRLEKAAALLNSDHSRSITEIALDTGFSGSAVFAKSFKEYFHVSASEWRRKKSNLDKMNSNYRKEKMLIAGYNYSDETIHIPVQIVRFPEITVAYVRYTGPYKGDEMLFEELFKKLYRWAEPRGIPDFPGTKTLVIYHDDPEITNRLKLRVSVCISVPKDTKVSGVIGKMEIPEGKYAMARFELYPDGFQQAWNWIYGAWLPQSGYLADDRPSFELYPEKGKTPEGRIKTDICIPVKPAG